GSATDPMRFIQFWILPSVPGLESSVQQRQYTVDDRSDRWLQVMGPVGEEGLDLAQDARVFVSRLTGAAELKHSFEDGRGGYLYVIDGAAAVGDSALSAGDAATIHGPEHLAVSTPETAELIVVDVPLQFEPVGVWAR
ncbi:MAG TPA: hypothetical protein VHG90_04060, partial [Acidimicrobiales bacterium]|nr:hypothetical protein [Acidimicrobiales bacterium]